MGALYLASKLEECPLRMRDLINVYDLLLQRTAHKLSNSNTEFKYAPMSYFGNTFYDLKDALVVAEMQILKRLGFNVNVVLPYGTLINYMRVLGLTNHEDACTKAWGYLNDAYVRRSTHTTPLFHDCPLMTQASNPDLRVVSYTDDCQRCDIAYSAPPEHPLALNTPELLVGVV